MTEFGESKPSTAIEENWKRIEQHYPGEPVSEEIVEQAWQVFAGAYDDRMAPHRSMFDHDCRLHESGWKRLLRIVLRSVAAKIRGGNTGSAIQRNLLR